MALEKIGKNPTSIKRMEDGLKVTAKDYNDLIDGIREFYPESGSVIVPTDSTATPSIVSTGAAGVIIGPTTAGFTTAGSHEAVLSGGGRWVVSSTSTTGGLGIDTTTGLVPVIKCVAKQTVAAESADAISVANFYTDVACANAGAENHNMAAGAVPGQLKKIMLSATGGGTVTITAAFAGAATTLTFTNAGETALLMWDGTDWIALELSSVATLTHAPVIS